MSRSGFRAGRTPDRTPSATDGSCHSDECPHPLPIDGVLDLHTFLPSEIKHLIPDYLEECRRHGLLRIRLIHGKGTGTLRRTVHAVLSRIPEVARFSLADEGGGGWGATTVELAPRPAKDNTKKPAEALSGDAGQRRTATRAGDDKP